MKKITLLLALLITSFGFSQQSLVQDFETGTDGLGQPFGGAAAEIVADPATGGTRGQVAKLTSSASGQVWQGININMASNVELTTDKTMQIDIYSNVALSIAPRVQGGLDGALVSTAVISHTGSGWETLTITFNTGSNGDATAEGVYSEFVIYYNWDLGTNTFGTQDARVIYADNITGIIQKELVQDFETGTEGLGAGFGGAAAEIVADPATGGTRGQVAKLTSSASGQVWQGININMTSNVRLTTDKTMQIDIYSNTALSIAPRVQGGLDGALTSTAVISHTGSGWETLTMTFNTGSNGDATAEGVYSEFVIYYNWDLGTNTFGTQDARVFYADNIKGIRVSPIAEPVPTDAAPTPPTFNAGDVVSLFSDAYTDIGIDTWSASWDSSTEEDIQVAGGTVKKITFGGFIGVEFQDAGRINATDFTHFHIDIWTATDTQDKSFNLKFSDWNGGAAEVSAIEFSTTNASTPTLPATNPGTWISLDIPFSSWTAGTRADLAQFLITSDLGVVYVDNIYMYKEGTASVRDNELLNVSMYPNPASDRLNISAVSTIKNASIYNVLGKKVMSLEINKNSESINVSELASGIYLIKYQLENATGTAKFIKE